MQERLFRRGMAERVPSGVVLVSAGVLVLARSKRSFGQREKGANFDKAAADDRPAASSLGAWAVGLAPPPLVHSSCPQGRRGSRGGNYPSTVRSGEWPAWFSFWFSGRWRALQAGAC